MVHHSERIRPDLTAAPKTEPISREDTTGGDETRTRTRGKELPKEKPRKLNRTLTG